MRKSRVRSLFRIYFVLAVLASILAVVDRSLEGLILVAMVIGASLLFMGLEYAQSSRDLRMVVRIQEHGLKEVAQLEQIMPKAVARVAAAEQDLERLTRNLDRVKTFFERHTTLGYRS